MSFTTHLATTFIGVMFGLLIGGTATAYAYAAVLVAEKLFDVTESQTVYVGTLCTFALSIVVALLNAYGARQVSAKDTQN